MTIVDCSGTARDFHERDDRDTTVRSDASAPYLKVRRNRLRDAALTLACVPAALLALISTPVAAAPCPASPRDLQGTIVNIETATKFLLKVGGDGYCDVSLAMVKENGSVDLSLVAGFLLSRKTRELYCEIVPYKDNVDRAWICNLDPVRKLDNIADMLLAKGYVRLDTASVSDFIGAMSIERGQTLLDEYLNSQNTHYVQKFDADKWLAEALTPNSVEPYLPDRLMVYGNQAIIVILTAAGTASIQLFSRRGWRRWRLRACLKDVKEIKAIFVNKDDKTLMDEKVACINKQNIDRYKLTEIYNAMQNLSDHLTVIAVIVKDDLVRKLVQNLLEDVNSLQSSLSQMYDPVGRQFQKYDLNDKQYKRVEDVELQAAAQTIVTMKKRIYNQTDMLLRRGILRDMLSWP